MKAAAIFNEQNDCRMCGCAKTALVTREEEWSVMECGQCGFVFVVPLPDEAFLNAHYQKYLPADTKGVDDWRLLMPRIFKRSLDALEGGRAGPERGTLLDVGCGHGFFLEEAKGRGWKVRGVDPCAHARDFARKNGLDVDLGTFPSQEYPASSFDAVTMFYVLEHVRDPMEYLREAFRVLKPKGQLLVRVPHTTPLVKLLKALNVPNRLYDTPSHLSDICPRTLRAAMERAGFDQCRTFPGGATRPRPLGERAVSAFSGWAADGLFMISGGRYLLPGVSKTTLARKR